MFLSEYLSPLGVITLASDGAALCGLWIEGQKYHGATNKEGLTYDESAQPFADAKSWLDSYFAQENPPISSLNLRPQGSKFQQAVWNELLKIPYGKTTTYGAIAKTLSTKAKKAAPIAVGGAVGHNPISIIVPCHRVVGSDGSLTGYAGGLSIKEELLHLEGVDFSKLYMPKNR